MFFNLEKIAFFNLDNTIIRIKKNLTDCDKIINLELPSGIVTFGFNIRPNLINCLNEIKNFYNIVIFTSSDKIYADSILNCIDPNRVLFDYRLYRNNCLKVEIDNDYVYIKDLRIIRNFNIKDMVIIDHSELNFAFHLENRIPIQPFIDNVNLKDDNEFIFLKNYLLYLSKADDIRAENNKIIKLSKSKIIDYENISSPLRKNSQIIQKINQEENKNLSILNEDIDLSNEYSFSMGVDDSLLNDEFTDILNELKICFNYI
jgi:CTD small phosphatase-like protein 2